MNILQMLGQQDAKARRPDFSIPAFIAAYPLHAAGVLGPRLNVRVRVDDEMGAVYDPVVDDDAAQLVVSLATPIGARSHDAVLNGAFRLALLRDRPQLPPSSSSPATAAPGAPSTRDVDEAADEAREAAASRFLTEAEAAERCIGADVVSALALVPTTAVAAANGPPQSSSAGLAAPSSFLGMWDAEDAGVVAAVEARVRRARPFVAPPLALLQGLWALCPRVYPTTSPDAPEPESMSDALRSTLRDRKRFEAVTGGLEAARCRLLRAGIDGDAELATALHQMVSSVVRRLQRRRLDHLSCDHDAADEDAVGRAYEVAAIRLRLPFTPVAEEEGGPTPLGYPFACGKLAAAALVKLRRCDAAGAPGVVAALVVEFGGVAETGEGRPNPLGVPNWWPVLLAWECAALEAEHIAAGN